MARKKTSSGKSSPSRSSSARAASPKEKQAKKNNQNAKAATSAPEATPLLDDGTRHDIVGIVLIVLGVALFFAVLVQTDAVVTHALATAIHLCLGLGAYLLPVVLIVVGVSFLVRIERDHIHARITIGLLMILVAVLALLALYTPTAAIYPSHIFVAEQLVARGGYLGGGIAWAGITLLGQLVTCIVLVGFALAGMVVIGFSVSRIIERIREQAAMEDEELGVREMDMPEPYVYRPADNFTPAQAAQAGPAATPQAANSVGSLKTIKIEKRPRRALTSLNTIDFESLAQSQEPITILEPQAPMTRRLGRQSTELPSADASAGSASLAGAAGSAGAAGVHGSAAAATVAMPKKRRKKAETPLATPQPQEGFELPPADLLDVSSGKRSGSSEADLRETGARLQETLEDFNIFAEVVGWVAGPTVTLFKVDLPAGVRVSRVTALEDDIALALAAPGVRIFAPIPGTNFVGIEVPNAKRDSVLLGDVLPHADAGPLQIAIGKDVEGTAIVSDLAKMPHLLIGGTTGSGKSVSINAMIMSILMRATPSEVRFIMIDPKRVEFTPYNGIPHLYVPVVTESKEAASALSWGVAEMERRLKVFSKVGARNIGQYNAKVQNGSLEDEEACELPYIVIIIDELADLMMNVGKEVEFSISRLAQLARAAGIHLIVATQRPSTNVVTGLIKANITNRNAFNVASGIDSRVILDTPGAENLIGLGDLLLSKPELAKPQRIQGCYVSEDEINAVVEMLKSQGEPEYHSEILQTNLITLGASAPDGSGGSSSSDDPLIWEAAEIVVSSGLGSTSNIQRRLKVGYARAGRIMDMLEEKGVVGPPNGSKPREVLVDTMELETLKAFEANDENSSTLYEEV